MNKKTTEIEIPKSATEQVVRLQLAEVTRAIQTARALRKARITVKVEQED